MEAVRLRWGLILAFPFRGSRDVSASLHNLRKCSYWSRRMVCKEFTGIGVKCCVNLLSLAARFKLARLHFFFFGLDFSAAFIWGGFALKTVTQGLFSEF